jgi:hypothetical protein
MKGRRTEDGRRAPRADQSGARRRAREKERETARSTRAAYAPRARAGGRADGGAWGAAGGSSSSCAAKRTRRADSRREDASAQVGLLGSSASFVERCEPALVLFCLSNASCGQCGAVESVVLVSEVSDGR